MEKVYSVIVTLVSHQNLVTIEDLYSALCFIDWYDAFADNYFVLRHLVTSIFLSLTKLKSSLVGLAESKEI